MIIAAAVKLHVVVYTAQRKLTGEIHAFEIVQLN